MVFCDLRLNIVYAACSWLVSVSDGDIEYIGVVIKFLHKHYNKLVIISLSK